MLFYFCKERFDYLLGRVEVRIAQNIKQMVVAKLMLLGVFGLVKSVGIYKQGAAFNAI